MVTNEPLPEPLESTRSVWVPVEVSSQVNSSAKVGPQTTPAPKRTEVSGLTVPAVGTTRTRITSPSLPENVRSRTCTPLVIVQLMRSP